MPFRCVPALPSEVSDARISCVPGSVPQNNSSWQKLQGDQESEEGRHEPAGIVDRFIDRERGN